MGGVPRWKWQRPGIRYTLERCAKEYMLFSQLYSQLRPGLRGGAAGDGVFANDFVIEWRSNYHSELAKEPGIDGYLRSHT